MSKSQKNTEEAKIAKLAEEHSKQFDSFTELEGLVIRGHILVERQINYAIERHILNKNEYKDDRFTFSKKMILCKMLGISRHFNQEIKNLNTLRNQIAHSLEFDKNRVDIIIREVYKKKKELLNLNDSREKNFAISISFICGAISAT
jgi:hypothetical protein